MTTTLTINSTSFEYPETGDENWGEDATLWASAVSTDLLQKSGGSFVLGAEVDFGPNFGVKSLYTTTRTALPATAGILRLANVDAVAWRDSGNTADLSLLPNATDGLLNYDGHVLVDTDTAQTLDLKTLTNAVFTSPDINTPDIDGGTIDGTVIGGTTPAAGSFTTADIDGGTIDGATIGGATPGAVTGTAGVFTSLVSPSLDIAAAGNMAIGATVGANNVDLGATSSTVVVKGNLQVDGTTTTVNSATLEVTDANITVNNGGNDAAAEGAGLTIERVGTDGAIKYEDALASKFKAGAVGSEIELANVSSTQTLTGKTLTGNTAASLSPDGVETLTFPVVTDTVVGKTTTDTLTNKTLTTPISTNPATQGFTNIDEIATPATPAANNHRLYYKSDGKLYTLNDAGEEVEVGAGGGGAGEINYVLNPDAEVNTDDWTVTATGAIARTTTGGEILRGDASFRLTAGAASDQINTNIVLPEADEGKLLKVSFDCKALGTYAAGDWICKVLNPSANELLSEDVPAGQGLCEFTWVSEATGTYVLRFESTKLIAAGNALVIDNVIVGPGRTLSGAAISLWRPFTAVIDDGSTTLSVGTGGSNEYQAYLRQVGGNMEVNLRLRFGAASQVFPTNAWKLTIPESKTVDSRFISTNTRTVIGVGVCGDNSGNSHTVGVEVDSAGDITFLNQANAAGLVTGSVPFTWATSDQLRFEASIPISEWAGSGTLETGVNNVEYASLGGTWDATDTSGTGTVYGPAGSATGGALTALRTKRVSFRTAIKPTDSMFLQISVDSGVSWQTPGSSSISTFKEHNSVSYGACVNGVGSNNLAADVLFGQYRLSSGATYGSAGTGWPSSFFWRVVKHSAGIPVGFGEASGTNLGLLKKPDSSVICDTPTGHGSSGTRIRTWTSGNVTTTGIDITYTSNTTTGDTFTINADGIYFFSYNDTRSSGAAALGVSKNASTTTNIASIAAADRLAYTETHTATAVNQCAGSAYLVAGDIIRVHTDGTPTGAAPYVQFRILQIMKL